MSDQPPETPGAGANAPGPEPAPGAPDEPTSGTGPDPATAETAGDVTAESSAAASGPTPPGGPLDGDAATPTPTTAPSPTTASSPTTGPIPAPASSGAASARPGSDGPGESGRPNRRKVREGLVLSVSMDKTAVVGVVDRVRHPRYVKTVQRTKRLYAHDESNQLRVGDRVRVAETRPMSRLKRWRIVEVLERAK